VTGILDESKFSFNNFPPNSQMKTGNKETKPRYGIINFEKRKYPRFSIDLPMEYSRTDSLAHPGQAANISEGGLLIYLPERVESGQRLRLRLFFASISESLHTMEVLAEVVWRSSEPGELGKNYSCGVKFIDARPMDMNKLKTFLDSLKSWSGIPSRLLT
jgi:c-di-GMP-binding flagellar brake protein YcgR